MSNEKVSSTKKKLRHLAHLSDAQDSALDRLVKKESKLRGTNVTRADVTREALCKYSREKGEEWPG
jgi:hypothetical protein